MTAHATCGRWGAMSAVNIGTCVAALMVYTAKSFDKVYRFNQSIAYWLSG